MTGRHSVLLLLCLLAFTAPASHAQSSRLHIQIVDGRMFLLAHGVPLRAILDEWERMTGVTFVNSDRLDDATPVTLELSGVTEQAALATLLRGVPGYIVARQTGTGFINRVLILAKTTAPPTGPTTAVLGVPASAPAITSFEASGDFAVGTPTTAPPNPVHSAANEVDRAVPAPMTGAEPTAAVRTDAVRINSSDAIVELVEGANAATVTPPELRPPTPLLREPAPAATRPGEISGGAPPPGFVDPAVTSPAHNQPTRVPTAGTSR